MAWTNRIAAMAALALVAGCAGDRRGPSAAVPVTVLPSVAASLTPAVYMQVVSSASLFAVRASELAQTRAQSGDLRGTASTVLRDQGGVASQLSFAGRRLELLPSAALPPAMEADLDRLRTSGDFDRDYRRLVGQALARAVEAHEVFARSGSSPTLRPVASMAAPVTRRNLQAVRR